MTTWNKKGIIFSPSGQYPWMNSHASLPLAWPLGDNIYRIYFASRDEENRSHLGYVEIDINQPREILELSDTPVLAPGPLGQFDDHGVYPGSIVTTSTGNLRMYYIGWNPGARGPLFYSTIGLAESTDGGVTFNKVSAAPIMGRSDHDPCLVTSPCVINDDGTWRMWYVSGIRWEQTDDGLASYYHIKHATSTDGRRWDRRGEVCIDFAPGEKNIARPCVWKEDGQYHMWYCYNRGNGYRLGCATSADGLDWNRRDDDTGIDLSKQGWDDEAQAYPWIFTHEDTRYLLYNGNGYGRTGFGLATRVIS